MPRYLIEVSHEDARAGCRKAHHSMVVHGAHFVPRADWGCRDGVHAGWLMVDVPDRESALRIVPPELRPDCRVIALSRWTPERVAAEFAELAS